MSFCKIVQVLAAFILFHFTCADGLISS